MNNNEDDAFVNGILWGILVTLSIILILEISLEYYINKTSSFELLIH